MCDFVNVPKAHVAVQKVADKVHRRVGESIHRMEQLGGTATKTPMSQNGMPVLDMPRMICGVHRVSALKVAMRLA